MGQLILKRAKPLARPAIGAKMTMTCSQGEVVGRIMKVTAAPESTPWMWTLAYGHRDRSPTHGYEAAAVRWDDGELLVGEAANHRAGCAEQSRPAPRR